MIGLVIFGVASAAAAFATTAAMARDRARRDGRRWRVHDAVDAVGARQHLPGARTRQGDLGVVGRWPALVTAVGPVVGGLLLARFWWGSVFLVNVPDRDRGARARRAVGAAVARSRVAAGRPLERAALVGCAQRHRSSPSSKGPQRGWDVAVGAARGRAAVGAASSASLKREDRSLEPLIEDETRARPATAVGCGGGVGAVLRRDGHRSSCSRSGSRARSTTSALATGLYFVPTAITSVLFALLNPRWRAPAGATACVARPRARRCIAVGALVAAISVVAESLPGVVVAGALVGVGIGIAAVSGVELIMSSARPERAGSASGVNETLVEASGALGIAVLGSVLVETGSYAWPLPVRRGGRGGGRACGIARRRSGRPRFRRSRASRRSSASADALSSSGAPDPSIDARATDAERVVVEPHLGARQLVLVRAAPARTAAGRRR